MISLVSSVILKVDIPDSLDGSFYTGPVYIALKDAAFQASSLLQHCAEMHFKKCGINMYSHCIQKADLTIA